MRDRPPSLLAALALALLSALALCGAPRPALERVEPGGPALRTALVPHRPDARLPDARPSLPAPHLTWPSPPPPAAMARDRDAPAPRVDAWPLTVTAPPRSSDLPRRRRHRPRLSDGEPPWPAPPRA